MDDEQQRRMELQQFEDDIKEEIDSFNKRVDEIKSTINNEIYDKLKISQNSDYSSYLKDVMNHNMNCTEDDFIEPLTKYQWENRK